MLATRIRDLLARQEKRGDVKRARRANLLSAHTGEHARYQCGRSAQGASSSCVRAARRAFASLRDGLRPPRPTRPRVAWTSSHWGCGSTGISADMEIRACEDDGRNQHSRSRNGLVQPASPQPVRVGLRTDMKIHRLSERPDLIERMYEVDPNWPAFMRADPVMNAFFGQVAATFPHLCAVATDARGAVTATGRAVAFTLDLAGRGALPDGGLDWAMVWAFSDRLAGRAPDTASAVEIAIGQEHRGAGLSHHLLAALRDAARDAGLTRLVAPVRPNEKHRYPMLPMAEYITMVREDGLPADPWLRVHIRAGGKIRQVAAASMVMAGSIAEWREWTGLPFDRSGDVIVPEALVPVHCDAEHDHAVYVEPNVWIEHTLSDAGTG
jgi:GNAT superfamily N-acetyltransferase